MDMNLYGKVALVSGCSQGLGYHAALALAKQGADIFGVSIGDDSSLKKAIEATGRNYHSFTISLTTPGAIHQVMKEALAAYGHIDILLNYAAILKKEETLELTKLEWNSAYDINVSVAFFLSLEVIRQFQKQGHGGKIINATGILPRHTSAYCAYAISNGAIEAMTRYLAMEFGKDQIQVNAIQYGFMSCGSTLQGEKEEWDTSLLTAIPIGRWGMDQDSDGLVTLLASDASNYITGVCIPVDGGYSI